MQSRGLAVSSYFSNQFKPLLGRHYTLAWKCEQARKINKELAQKRLGQTVIRIKSGHTHQCVRVMSNEP